MRHRVLPRVQPHLQPPRPARDDAGQRQRRVGQLDQQLVLQVGDRVAVGQQQRAAGRRTSAETPAASRFCQLPARTRHSNKANTTISSTKTRCCSTSISRKLSKKPMSPIGQISGSERKNRNTGEAQEHQRPVPRPAHPGPVQQRQQPDRDDEQSGPMVVVFRPRDIVGVARRQVAGAGHERRPAVPRCDARPRRPASPATPASPACRGPGLLRRGHSGVLRSTISCQVTRSWVRSTAGGTEVSDAAAKKIATPMPISTSAKRRRRLTGVAGLARSRSTSRKFIPPERQQHQEHGDLGADHDAVGGAVEALPVADIQHAHGDAADQDAGDAGHRHAGEPGADQPPAPSPSRTRASASRKQGMPPIQIAAPS